MDLRKKVTRKDPPSKKSKITSPLDAIDAGTPGEVKISADAQVAIAHLYNSSPSIQAARTILMGQLLSSGVVVRRNGTDVPLKPTFQKHLESLWLPFARNVIDSFLCYGFAVVSLEEEPLATFANFKAAKKNATTPSDMNPQDAAERRLDPPDASETRAKKSQPAVDDRRASKRVVAEKEASAANLVPFVPDVGTYELSFVRSGQLGYRRSYRIFGTNSDSVYRQDFTSEIFFKSEPDIVGNINSAVACVYQSAAFIAALEELALQAEVVRARQLLVTQPIQRQHQNQNLDPANLFFDSESRAVQASATAEDDAAQASSLATQALLMRKINSLQTTESSSKPSGSTAAGVPGHVPPAHPPQLFAAPASSQVVPGVRPPEARSDLVDLMRVVNDHIAAAMGVPASVIFEGKFSSNSMSQLQLLNTTVQSLALSVNRVLSSCYHAIYDDAIEGDELVLLTAPLSSTAEVQALYTAGIVDIESAIPAALHSLGCSATEIEGALARRREAEKANGDSKLLEAQTAAQVGDADVKLKAAQALKTQEEIEGVRAGVEKSRAEVKKIEHDANAPYPSTTPAEPPKKKKDDNGD